MHLKLPSKFEIGNEERIRVLHRMPIAQNSSSGEMIDKLTLAFNRTRQAVITRELIEIISGAACV
ncbi:hypothetical protein ANCDUO_16524 [Ancylostoma duodenale]|uniref:Uncharacterized protein n=1 Tax=Ancylostoma duodenale TaxID=51022 RepID=A0A0C2FXS3_9BILA|nr:hypothetical protein ANCDUO_16524 [Ancylostoma duodenale]